MSSPEQWTAKKRQPATFYVEGVSPVTGAPFSWRVRLTEAGVVATRKSDGRRVSLDWRTLIGLAMFHGKDSARADKNL